MSKEDKRESRVREWGEEDTYTEEWYKEDN